MIVRFVITKQLEIIRGDSFLSSFERNSRLMFISFLLHKYPNTDTEIEDDKELEDFIKLESDRKFFLDPSKKDVTVDKKEEDKPICQMLLKSECDYPKCLCKFKTFEVNIDSKNIIYRQHTRNEKFEPGEEVLYIPKNIFNPELRIVISDEELSKNKGMNDFKPDINWCSSGAANETFKTNYFKILTKI